jgi:Family of unknown function (DUF5336)
MTGSPDTPDAGRAEADSRSAAAPADADRPRSGPVAELALVAAGLGLVVYLLGFVDDFGLGRSVVGPLLLGGGLLAGSVALPTVRAGVLAPAAAAIVTGALFLLQTVVGGTDSPVAVGALVLGLLEAAAAGVAALLHAGVLRAPKPRPKPKPKTAAAPPYAGYPPQPGYPQFPGQQFAGQQFPGQQYPGQPFPGSYPGHPGEPYPGDQYAGEHAYAQYARYGTQYGVPGYPPPPPYGGPGYEPNVPGAEGRSGYERSAAPVPGIPADQPTAVTATGGFGPAAASTAEPGAAAPTAVHGTGTHRAAETVRPSATGSHAAAPSPSTAPDAAGGRSDGDDDDRTRAIPTVPDER